MAKTIVISFSRKYRRLAVEISCLSFGLAGVTKSQLYFIEASLL